MLLNGPSSTTDVAFRISPGPLPKPASASLPSVATGFDLGQILVAEVVSALSGDAPQALQASPETRTDAILASLTTANTHVLVGALGNPAATRTTAEFLAILAAQDSIASPGAIATSIVPARTEATPAPSLEPNRTVQVAREALSESAPPTTKADQDESIAASGPDLAGEAAQHFGANAIANLPALAAEPGRGKRATVPVSAVPASEGLRSRSESANPGTYLFSRSRPR